MSKSCSDNCQNLTPESASTGQRLKQHTDAKTAALTVPNVFIAVEDEAREAYFAAYTKRSHLCNVETIAHEAAKCRLYLESGIKRADQGFFKDGRIDGNLLQTGNNTTDEVI